MAEFIVRQMGSEPRTVKAEDIDTAESEAPTGAQVLPSYSELVRHSGGRSLSCGDGRTVFYYPPNDTVYVVLERTKVVDGEKYSNYVVDYLADLPYGRSE